ncbi:RNA-binding S4 domain-containing protein [Streptomyces sp. NPDC051997]|uniref:RNA-binding S4 domain-containing protein n=1 Tax=Streptomyces sp. NPDC051997 TaxID=3155611 RepID=UPI0034361681
MASQGADRETKGAGPAGGRCADGGGAATTGSDPGAGHTSGKDSGDAPGATSRTGSRTAAGNGPGTASRTASGTGPGAGAGTKDGAGAASGNAAAVEAAVAAAPAGGESVRVDAWIWSVRLVKTRSIGATACKGGHVRVNGERVKPAYSVRVGDEVRVWHEGRERVVIVKRVIRKRVGAPVAAECFVDNSPPPPPREAVAPAGVRDRGAGRPTKRDRRDMERLRGMQTGSSGPVRTSGPSTGPTGPARSSGTNGPTGSSRH